LQRDIWRIADLDNGIAVLYGDVDTAQRGISLYAVWGATDCQGAEHVKRSPIDSSNGGASARIIITVIRVSLVGHVDAPRSGIEGNPLGIGGDGNVGDNPVAMAVDYIQFLAC